MTSNFKILADFEVSKRHELVVELITKIENNILSQDLDNIFMNGRKILEIILSDEYGDIFSLDSTIKAMMTQRIVPSKVKNALFGIKQKSNEAAHITKMSDRPYAIKKDIFSIVEFLKQLFIIIKFFVKENYGSEWVSENDNEYTFSSSVYLSNVVKTMDPSEVPTAKEGTDVKPDTETLESKLKGIFELISSDYSFLIPTYQREYSWKEENINVFLQDIKDRSFDKQTHYMGSLAIGVDEKNQLLRLIDGQQRITTSLLLIKVLHEAYKAKSAILKMPIELDSVAKDLNTKYKNQAGEYGDLNYIKKILSGDTSTDRTFRASHAFKNFTIIQEYINGMAPDVLEEYYTTFVYYFVIAELRFKSDLGQEIQIFENLNSKGTELSQWDLIKNYIYKNVELQFLLKHETMIESMLNKLFVIKSSVAFGNAKRFTELSNFFAFYSRIESKLEHGKTLSDKGKIHKVFAKMWPGEVGPFTDINSLNESLVRASRLFSIYCELKSKRYLGTSDSPLFKFRLHLENTSAKDTHYALVMNAIYSSCTWNGTDIEKIDTLNGNLLKPLLSDIDKYITRLLVVSNVGQSLSTMFDGCISNSVKESHGLLLSKIMVKGKQSSLPSFQDFKKIIRTKTDWQKEYALSVMRTYEAAHSVEEIGKYKITLKPSLEHIFPQKPALDGEWFIQEDVSLARFKEKHSSRLNKLGNYLILSKPINSKVSNNPYPAKKIEYLKDDSPLLNGNDNLMNLKLKSSFTFEDIDERTKQLAELVSPLYKMSNGK